MYRFGKCAIAVLLVIALLVSLSACSLWKKSEKAPEKTPEPEATAPAVEPEETPPPEPEQDLSGVTKKSDWSPMFPDFADSITWNAVPRDYIGGLGTQVSPKQDNKGYVNVREGPSIKAKVIGEIHHQSDVIWSVIDELYQEDGQLFVGSYSVRSDDYTWIPVEGFNEKTGTTTVRGWAAMEVLDLWAI